MTQADDDRLERELEGHHYTLWVEGRKIVHTWDAEGRVQADRLTHAADALGLHTFRQPLPDESDPEEAGRRRRWTHRRVTQDELRRVIAASPGVKFNDLVEALYREPPWTELKQQQARSKLRVALHRLRTAGYVVKRYDEAGVERWQPANVATGLRLTPAGPVAAVPDETHLPRAALLADQLAAGATVLRRLNVFDDTALRHDPSLYDDLVRAIWQAMEGAKG